MDPRKASSADRTQVEALSAKTRTKLKWLLPSALELRNPHRFVANHRLYERLRAEGYLNLGPRRARTLLELARRVERDRISGDIVDCGVWNGGSTVLLGSGAPSRNVWALDSFEGLPKPGPRDPDAAPEWEGQAKGSEEIVREGFARYASRPERLNLVKGWFDKTVPDLAKRLNEIAILHIDADWYDSVRIPLEGFYENVVPGGFIAVDDLRMWQGAQQATSEFRHRISEPAPIRAAYYWQKGVAGAGVHRKGQDSSLP